MYNFEEINSFEIDDVQASKLKNLLAIPEFLIFQDWVEKEIIKKTMALVVGTPTGDEGGYLKELRGFARTWHSLISRLKKFKAKEKNNE